MIKKFLEGNFPRTKIELDWEISRQIERYRNDIVNAKRNISIKSSPSLAGIWAEADVGSDYGVLVKVSIPKDFFLKILAHISSLKKLLNFVNKKIKENQDISKTKELISFIKDSSYKDEMFINTFICGYFKTSKSTLKKKGDEISYLGGSFEVFEEKHIVKLNELKFSFVDWENFVNEIKVQNINSLF